MGSINSLSTKQRLFAVSCVVLGCVLLLSAGARSSSGVLTKQDVNLPTVRDDTGSFDLVSVERIDRRLVTRVQNISKKAVTAYVVAICDVPEYSADYSISERRGVEPGQMEEITTSVKSVSEKCDSALAAPTISILAVVFDDRTYRGEFQWAKGILDDRRGQKIQLKRINRFLAEALKKQDGDEFATLEMLKAQISMLPVDEDEGSAVRGGLSQAKKTALFLLGELEQWHQAGATLQSERSKRLRGELLGIGNLREGFDKIVRFNEKLISRY
jgi:hypothetical protein